MYDYLRKPLTPGDLVHVRNGNHLDLGIVLASSTKTKLSEIQMVKTPDSHKNQFHYPRDLAYCSSDYRGMTVEYIRTLLMPNFKGD